MTDIEVILDFLDEPPIETEFYAVAGARGLKGDKGDTGNGISSTVLNQDYTLTIEFTNGTSYTTLPIRGAKGDIGVGIAYVTLNDDYTLTITFDDGTSYTTESIRGLKGDKGDKGDTGNGISSTVLNQDYTLTLTFTNGSVYTTPPIRGAQGNTGVGIASTVLNNDYTLTINYDDGTSYTTGSIRGLKGDKGDKGDTGNGIVSTILNNDNTLTITFDDGSTYTTTSIKGDKGDTGIGVDSVELNQDYTLTINLTDGTSYTTTSIRGLKGDTGNGIVSTVMNQDYTLTITFDDGTSYTTEPIRGEKGDKGNTGDTRWDNGTGVQAVKMKGGTTVASGDYSIAEGYSTKATFNYAHAEGRASKASDVGAHAEGYDTEAHYYAHAEGYQTVALGDYTHAEGQANTASGRSTHVGGEFASDLNNNNLDNLRGTYAEIIGNGISSSQRSNARTLDWNGNEWISGKMTVGAGPVNDMDVATKKYVDDTEVGAIIDDTAGDGVTDKAWSADKIVDELSGKIDTPATAGTSGQVLTSDGNGGQTWETPSSGNASIDDTAGDGDTDKVWSADKVVDELAGKIDTPATAGTNGQVLMSDGNGGQSWQDEHVPAITTAKANGVTTIYADGVSIGTVADGDKGDTGATGANGNDGADGYSPTASVSKSGDTVTITVTDKNGTTTATILDGANGSNGQDGHSPAITTSKSGKVTTILSDGVSIGMVNDGADGQNGQDGAPGQGIASGGTTGQVLKKKSGTDYDTEWGDEQTIPVTDVQVNSTSIVSNGVADIPKASSSAFGVIKAGGALRAGSEVTGGNSDVMYITPSSLTGVKNGTSETFPLAPSVQHAAAFYGLATAAGDTTQKNSSNAVGTYTDSAKASINTMIGSVSKDSVNNAGITARSYSTKFGGEFSVTTETNASYISPYKRSSVTGRISKFKMHRVTVSGTEYMLRCRLWFEGSKIYEYLGNLGLYVSDISGVPGGTDNVPFVIISDLNSSESIDVLTSTAGSYTILVEEQTETLEKLPNSLIYGDYYVPINRNDNSGTYNGFSIGVNELKNKRGTFAVGYGNSIQQEFSVAIGNHNVVNSQNSFVEGDQNTLNQANSMGNHVEGKLNTVGASFVHVEGTSNTVALTASNSHIEGAINTVAASASHVEGSLNTATDTAASSHVEGSGTIASTMYSHISGQYNVADTLVFTDWIASTSYAVGDIVRYNYRYYICKEENSDSSWTAAHWDKYPSNGTAAFIIGNGTGNSARSNAMKVDWFGNQYLDGDVYVNCNADSSGGTKLVSETDYATSSTAGVVVVDATNGIGIESQHKLYINYAESNLIKAGTGNYRPISPPRQHESVFYGLAKAAGDTTQASSSNAVGTYTDSAKTAIRSMIGVDTAVVPVSGTDPVITADANTRYTCGELYTLSFTPPSSGITDVIFTSGTTPTVLTLPNTVKMPEWFTVGTLDANTIYEINIVDGTYGAVMSWPM